jgi:hypothetical protein
MSEQSLCIVLTVLVIALMLVWVPILEFVCPRCSHAIKRFWRGRSQRDVRRRGAARAKTQHG